MPRKRSVKESTTSLSEMDDKEEGKDDEKSPPHNEAGGAVSAKYSPVQRHQQFLHDLASLRPDSKAAEFLSAMMSQCKREGTDKMGGKVVDDTINSVIAAMLKHLGLIEIARKYANDYESTPINVQERWSEKLLFVFRKGKQLRSWIINEKQRNQQEKSAKETEAKEKGATLSEEELAKMSKWTSYEGICAEIRKKAQFLLAMRPFCGMFMEGISDEETTGFSMTLEVSRLKTLERAISDRKVSSTDSPDGSDLDQWKLAFDTWKVINTFQAHKLQQKQDKAKGVQSLPDMIITFIQKDTPLESFEALILRHRRRAKMRCDSMRCLLDLLRADGDAQPLQCLSPKVSLLREWKCPLREYGDYDNGPRTVHFLSNVQSCGQQHEDAIRATWESLYLYFADLIKSVDVAMPLKQHAISAWAVALSPGEETFVASTKILDAVHSMLSQYVALLRTRWDGDEAATAKEVEAVVGIEWKAMSLPHQKENHHRLLQSLSNLLSLMLMRFNDGKRGWSNTAMPTPDDLNLSGLQMQILKCTHSEIMHHIDRLTTIKAASHRNAQIHIAEENNDWDSNADIRFIQTSHDNTFLEVEQLIYSHIACIRHLTYRTDSRPIRSFLVSDAFLITLCQLLCHGTPRIKRIALIILRDLAKYAGPSRFAQIDAIGLVRGTASRPTPSAKAQPAASETQSLSPAKSALGMLTKMEDTATTARKQSELSEERFGAHFDDAFNIGDEVRLESGGVFVREMRGTDDGAGHRFAERGGGRMVVVGPHHGAFRGDQTRFGLGLCDGAAVVAEEPQMEPLCARNTVQFDWWHFESDQFGAGPGQRGRGRGQEIGGRRQPITKRAV